MRIDGILVEREGIRPHYARLTEIMKDNPMDIVQVYCPLDICRQRNLARECADIIVKTLFSK